MNRLVVPGYILFLIFFTFFSYLFLDPNLFYFKGIYSGFAFLNRPIATSIYIVSVLILFGFYWLFLIKNFNYRFLVLSACIILFFSYSAMLSQDIFNYLTTAKVIFNYHENPYVVMPIEFIGDTNLLFTHAANKIALYGPAWIVLTAIPYFFGFGNFILTLFNFKLFVVFFYLGSLWLINKLSKNNYSVILFALNPLVVIEVLIGNHNDIVMMFFALLSFFFLKKKNILLAILFLSTSVLIKYATIFLLPIFIFSLIKIVGKENINWDKTFYYSSLSMILIFLLSALRVEIYPWYAIWFLAFSFLVPQRKLLLFVSLGFSLGLEFRYIPFMFFGTHFGIAPVIKSAATFLPVFIALAYGYFKKIYT